MANSVPEPVPVEPIDPNTPATPTIPATPMKSKSKRFTPIMILVLFLLLISCLGVAGYFAYNYFSDNNSSKNSDDQSNAQDEENNNAENADNDNNAENADCTDWTGEFIKACVPTGWTVTEYKNGQGGYGILSLGSYQGLTAFIIKNSDNKVVFKEEGAWGIGGVDYCTEVAKFSDTQQSYIDQVQADAVAGGQVASVTQLGNGAVNFTLFGTKGRFLDGKMYWDVANINGVFNPGCGMSGFGPKNTGLSFTFLDDAGNSNVTTYMAGITADFAQAQAATLGELLSTVEKI